MTEQEAKNALLTLEKGRDIVIVAGKKHPKGLRGTVRWYGMGDYGPSLGFLVPGEQKLRYTSPSNVQGIFPGLNPGDEPEGGWVALYEEVKNNTTVPKRDDVVRCFVNEVGWVEGAVFWTGEGRVGFKVQGQTEGIFVGLEEAQILMGDGSWKSCKVPVRAVPKGLAPAPSGFRDLSLEDDDNSTSAPASHKQEEKKSTFTLLSPLSLPPPFCDIRQFVPKNGMYVALDQNGEEICVLPEETVKDIFAQTLTPENGYEIPGENLDFENLNF